MRCVVLGGCGFIGAHVVDGLVAAGHEVRALARRPEALRGPVPGVDYRFVDYRDRSALAEVLAGCDAVFHMISATTPGSGDLDPIGDINDNLVGTVAVLDLMLAAGISRLVYVSSGGVVYGVPEVIPIPEAHPLRPINSYGIVKAAIEGYIGLYSRTKGLSPVILRPSNTYGLRQGRDGSQGLVSTLLHCAATGGIVNIWGDGHIVRDHLHVDDLARLAVLAVDGAETGIFNVGSGVGTSVRELIGLVEDVTGQRLNVQYGPQRAVDVPVSVLDVTRAGKIFGWTPQIKLREGLVQCWDWHRELARLK